MSKFKFIIFTIKSEIIATIIRQEKTCKNYKIKNMWIMICQKNTPSVPGARDGGGSTCQHSIQKNTLKNCAYVDTQTQCSITSQIVS